MKLAGELGSAPAARAASTPMRSLAVTARDRSAFGSEQKPKSDQRASRTKQASQRAKQMTPFFASAYTFRSEPFGAVCEHLDAVPLGKEGAVNQRYRGLMKAVLGPACAVGSIRAFGL